MDEQKNTRRYLLVCVALVTLFVISVAGVPASAAPALDDPFGGAWTDSEDEQYWAFTPGFWKNHAYDAASGHDAWLFFTAYGDPAGDYVHLGDVFSSSCDYVDCDDNLLVALRKMRGDQGEDGAAQILLRDGIGSLLNGSFHETLGNPVGDDSLVDVFPYYSTYETCIASEGAGHETWCHANNVTELVNNALDSADRQTMLELAAALHFINNGTHFVIWP